jgi:acyl-CoA thioesterase I
MAVLSAAAPPQASTPAKATTLLVLGDSLSAGYGLSPGQGWVTLLEKRLSAQGYEYAVVNASSSGETTAGGLERLPRALQLHKPGLVIVELGANDGLRGLPVPLTKTNLEKIVELARDAGARVLLLGMRLPPNYGPRYSTDFTRMFEDLGREKKVPLVPFFLEPVALDPNMMQDDGLHPNVRAQPLLLESVWPHLVPLLGKR